MDEEEKQQRRTALKIGAIIFLLLLIGEEWYATQAVAKEAAYNPLLGSYITIGGAKVYAPWGYFLWQNDAKISQLIPDLLAPYANFRFLAIAISVGAVAFIQKNMKTRTEHGSAAWATNEDITKSDLGKYASKNGGVFEYKKSPVKIFGKKVWTKKEKILKTSGVVVGINPFTHRLMLHDGVEHMLLMAPTRSGKGVCTIIPTGLIWKHSIFFFDPKGELWSLTSGYRKKFLKQKVLKFQPLCTDGSAARWNPLAEVNYRTFEELSDVTTIVSVMVRPDGEQKGGDSFWPDSAAALLNGVIMHLLYSRHRERQPLPCPTDIMSFLSSPDKDTDGLFSSMRDYPHISPDEFMEKNDKTNPLKEIYGEYIKDLKPFSDSLSKLLGEKVIVHGIDEIRQALALMEQRHIPIDWGVSERTIERQVEGKNVEEPKKETQQNEEQNDNGNGNSKKSNEPYPFHLLLTHPKVAECAANMLNGAEQTRASIMQTAQTSLAVYQDPVVQANTAVSDFAIRDLLDPQQEVSLYLVMEVKDVQTIRPIARLFIQMLCSKLIRDMKFETDPKKPKPKKQRLLLMLDEFPQLGNMKCIELALAICAGYGIKMCIVCQDVNQLNKEYTKDNSIGSNCHVHIYFTPNLDSGGATAEAISKSLGKRTIDSVSKSSGKGWFDGSTSTGLMGRELMTPDEVMHMSSEKELVFVAGHKAILGDKLRYYEHPSLLQKTQIKPPVISDTVTQVKDYATLFAVHRADTEEREAKKEEVRKARENAEINLAKSNQGADAQANPNAEANAQGSEANAHDEGAEGKAEALKMAVEVKLKEREAQNQAFDNYGEMGALMKRAQRHMQESVAQQEWTCYTDGTDGLDLPTPESIDEEDDGEVEKKVSPLYDTEEKPADKD